MENYVIDEKKSIRNKLHYFVLAERNEFRFLSIRESTGKNL